MPTFGTVKKTGAQEAEPIEAAEETLAMQFTSRPGSCKSLCASSRKTSVALKALRIAQLQEYRVEREVELQRALLEAQSKTELAKIELEAEEDSPDEAWEPVASADRLARATSSSFCATFALRKTVKEFGLDYAISACSAIDNNLYVDDCLKSLPDPVTAKCFVNEISALLSKGGFRMRNWSSNNRGVLSVTAPTELTSGVRNLTTEQLPIKRALGVQ
ncbi:hypothetical protein CLF_101458 [Clonorchis sinensis]|uniref:Uncharacterized protein n=1 Tax=Clonorchis sinensis TaxID=79923 RepID=G7Y5T0_CLOSI|nr:hypothetical protein CLF_101458 [Clonorchis sinensis]